LLDPNFKATYNVYRAAKDAGCLRVIFASSINAVSGYPTDRPIYPQDAPCPANVYGVSKAFGESLGSYFAYCEGLSVICIRIGAVGRPGKIKPGIADWLRDFVSYADLSHLFDRCIETPDIPFAIAHGVSNNRELWMDLAATRELLGYHPQDDAFAWAEKNAKGN
jgi:nucleoside-diphosphate-sugar epimerase